MITVYWNSQTKTIVIHNELQRIYVHYKKSILKKQTFFYDKTKNHKHNQLVDEILIVGKRIIKLKKNSCRTIITGKQIEYRFS